MERTYRMLCLRLRAGARGRVSAGGKGMRRRG
jgi:hypothetical protein